MHRANTVATLDERSAVSYPFLMLSEKARTLIPAAAPEEA
jgi:hypothetical protein